MQALYDDTHLTHRQWAADVLIALAVFLYSWAHLILSSGVVVMQDTAFRQLVGYLSANPTPAMVVALALMSAPLVVRRRFPLPVTAVTFLLYIVLVQAVGGYGVLVISPAVALFSVAEKGDLHVSLVAAGVLIAAELLMDVPFINANLMWILQIQNVSIFVIATALGVAIATYRRYVFETQARAAADAEARAEEAERRISQERTAIAREVHDITAHSLTAVNLQATAAERLIDTDPETAKQAIRKVRTTSKEALTQIRQLVRGLRQDDEDAEMSPSQGTEALESLCEFASQAHIHLTIDRTNYRKDLVAQYVGVVLFDIAREAMTNVIRHAHATRAHIELGISNGYAFITISDDGVGFHGDAGELTDVGEAQPDSTTYSGGTTYGIGLHGNGLVGMAERARVLDGTFSAHNGDAGGFVVHAEIPVTKDEDDE